MALSLWGGTGCSINKSRMATEQLVVSDAVDEAVAQVDFSPLTGRKVYFDTKYLASAKLPGQANVDYVISALRQQMLAYDLRLVDKAEEADLVVEGRVGTLGNDGNEITYGVPGSAALGTASIFLGSPVPAPTMPELSLGRRNHHWGAAKIGLFAYDRHTQERVWQAGVTTGTSQARELWVVGVGPFHRGSVYRKLRRGDLPRDTLAVEDPRLAKMDPVDAYSSQIDFRSGREPKSLEYGLAPSVQPASTGK